MANETNYEKSLVMNLVLKQDSEEDIVDILMDEMNKQIQKILDEIDDPRGRSLAVLVQEYLKRMTDVGVGYLSLFQKTETLSGGEAKSLRIAANLFAVEKGFVQAWCAPRSVRRRVIAAV